MEERKLFLKKNCICFRCCGSTRHVAKDCKEPIKCMECGSEKHISALHPSPPSTKQETSKAKKHDGGEVSDNAVTPVTSKCTGFGNADNQCSCSKIILVKVYPTGKREEAKKMYALLDEQSNKSPAKSEFFHLFNITTSAESYMLKT